MIVLFHHNRYTSNFSFRPYLRLIHIPWPLPNTKVHVMKCNLPLSVAYFGRFNLKNYTSKSFNLLGMKCFSSLLFQTLSYQKISGRTLSPYILTIRFCNKFVDVCTVFSDGFTIKSSKLRNTGKSKDLWLVPWLVSPLPSELTSKILKLQRLPPDSQLQLTQCPLEFIAEHLKKFELNNRYPPLSVLESLAYYFSLTGFSEGFNFIKEICSRYYPKEFCNCYEFSHYTAQLYWVKSDVKRSINIFSKFSNINGEINKQISVMLRQLILCTTANKGRASITIIVEFCLEFSRNHRDYSVLATLWYVLFISDWFDDQRLSLKILQDNHDLQVYLETIMVRLSAKFLLQNKINDNQRLLETVLQCGMEKCTAPILRGLFDYYYQIGNHQGCCAVAKCSEDLDINLTADQRFKFQNLSHAKQHHEHKISSIIKKVDQFKFKF